MAATPERAVGRTTEGTRREAARAMVRGMQPVVTKHIAKRGRDILRATLTSISGTAPYRTFTADVHGYPNINVGDHNVTFGQWVSQYDVQYGLTTKDNLILVEIAEDDYIAIDVESDTPLRAWRFLDDALAEDLNSIETD